MTLRERIDNNLTLYALGLLATGFVAGIATDEWASKVTGNSNRTVTECTTEAWQSAAKKEQWLPIGQCPAFPLEIKISSPGSGATFTVEKNYKNRLYLPFVISGSRPLPDRVNIGIVFQVNGTPNLYSIFPGFNSSADNNAYKHDWGIELPFDLQPSSKLTAWALVVDDKSKIGERYTSLDQIRSADPSVFISAPISLLSEPMLKE